MTVVDQRTQVLPGVILFHVRWVNDQPCDSKDVIVLRNPVRIDMYRGEMARLCECPLSAKSGSWGPSPTQQTGCGHSREEQGKPSAEELARRRIMSAICLSC